MTRSATTTRPAIVGHRGARALAPENTIAGIDAAIAAGADAVELDVRRDSDGRLVLAHGRRQARRPPATRLEEALEFLADPERERVGLVLDVKEQSTAPSLVAALDAIGLAQRTIACARTAGGLRALGDAEPPLRRAWSIKRARHVGVARLARVRGDLPAAVGAALREGLAELVSVHRSLVTARLAARVHAAGGEIYVWDVASAGQALTLSALGVDALIGDDPALLRAALIPRWPLAAARASSPPR